MEIIATHEYVSSVKSSFEELPLFGTRIKWQYGHYWDDKRKPSYSVILYKYGSLKSQLVLPFVIITAPNGIW